jgi:CubicO group peptidase (beta-lactamase class C family)
MVNSAKADYLSRPRPLGPLELIRLGCGNKRSLRQDAFQRICTIAVLCGAIWLISACTELATMEVDPTDAEALRYARSGDLEVEVDSLAQPLIDRGVAPGAMVGVLLPDGSTRFFGSEVGRSAKPNRDTLFAVGSLSKGFLGAVAALLVQEGRVSWNDTLEELLPTKTPLSAGAQKITVLQLATHTSGLPRQPLMLQMFIPFFTYLFTGESFYDPLDRDYVLHYLSSFDAPSHVEYRYSNIGYGILGYALTQKTGLSLDMLLQQEIAKPLGLKNTGYVPEALPGYATRARGYAGDQPKFIRRGTPVPDWQFTDIMQGGTALYSTAEDLLTFAASYLRAGHTRLAAMTDTLRVRVQRPKDAAAVAWSFDEFNGEWIAHQIGVVAGYSSYLGLDIEHRTAVVVLQNTFNWDESIGSRLLVRMGRAQDRWKQGKPELRDARRTPTIE